jgi:hypothetical protein
MLERYVLGSCAWKMEMVAWRMWITKALSRDVSPGKRVKNGKTDKVDSEERGDRRDDRKVNRREDRWGL